MGTHGSQPLQSIKGFCLLSVFGLIQKLLSSSRTCHVITPAFSTKISCQGHWPCTVWCKLARDSHSIARGESVVTISPAIPTIQLVAGTRCERCINIKILATSVFNGELFCDTVSDVDDSEVERRRCDSARLPRRSLVKPS
jgi:hypothetical protein